MLTAPDRIQTKGQLKDWLKFECSKYSSGGGHQVYTPYF